MPSAGTEVSNVLAAAVLLLAEALTGSASAATSPKISARRFPVRTSRPATDVFLLIRAPCFYKPPIACGRPITTNGAQ